MLLDQLDHTPPFCWFAGLIPDDLIWDPTNFTKNSKRVLTEQVMGRYLEKTIRALEIKPLLSNEHFSVDVILLQAWLIHASLERINGQSDPLLPPSGPSENFGAPKQGKSGRKEISASSNSATRPTAPASIRTHYRAENPIPIQHCPVTGGTCSYTTAKH